MNKNTKRRNNQLRKAGRAGNSDLTFARPAGNYHSAPKAFWFKDVSYPVPARANKDGIVSISKQRNMQEKVYRNQGPKGSTATFHEPAIANQPIRFKNHDYLKTQYRQPSYIAS